MPTPANQTPQTSNTRGTWARRPSEKPGCIKFGDLSIKVDQSHYTDYATVIHTTPQNSNDGWEHFLNRFEKLPKAMVNLEYVETYPSESIEIALDTHFNVVQDGQFVLDAIDMVDNITCGAEQAYCRTLAISGTSHILSEPVTYPPAYYFMANPELTAASLRQVTTMSNIYHVQNLTQFQQIHQAIKMQTTRRDMMLAYTKHHLEGFSIMMMDE
jgi:hypothetical protein